MVATRGEPRSGTRSRGRVIPLVLVLAAACAAPPSPRPLPEAPPSPGGWSSIGVIAGESASGRTISRLALSGRPVGVNATCRGEGTLFVIVGWSDVSPGTGPVRFRTVAFPCSSPVEGTVTSRIELPEPAAGEADVNAFVVEGAGAIGRTTYAVSIEERIP